MPAPPRLDREGFWWRPSWLELREGKRPPENTTGEPGEWQHGWQYWASSVSDSPELTFGHTQRRRCPGFRSDSSEYVIPTRLFRVLLLERLQLPLSVDEAVCSG